LGQKTEDGRPKRPNINLLPIIFLSFLPTGKVADNQIKKNRCDAVAWRIIILEISHYYISVDRSEEKTITKQFPHINTEKVADLITVFLDSFSFFICQNLSPEVDLCIQSEWIHGIEKSFHTALNKIHLAKLIGIICPEAHSCKSFL
jgi:hypothetical protein